MSAYTQWYVLVVVPKEEWREVQAITRLDAEHEAAKGTLGVVKVLHWSEYEAEASHE